MAVYSPALMLQPVGNRVAEWGFIAAAAYMVLKAVIAVTLWGVTAIGYFFAPVGWIARLIAFGSAVLLVLEYPYTDPIGFVCCAAFFAYQFWQHRGRQTAAGVKAAG